MAGRINSLLGGDNFTIIARDGTIRSQAVGTFAGNTIIIEDATVAISAGDEIRRLLPSGLEETWEVESPNFYKAGAGRMGPHYQVKVTRKGTFKKGAGGYYLNVSGNGRVNINSHDHSTNIHAHGDVITDLTAALTKDGADETILAALGEMQSAIGKPEAASAYQRFIASAGKHMAIIAPFLGPLATMLHR